MGGIRPTHGRVTLESRRESFYVHIDYPDDHPLAERWFFDPHPEIDNEDLGDLIAALIELRENPR